MQTNEEHIEQQLWEYIDGTCSDTERARIAMLIANDAAWKSKYEELQALHAEVLGILELEQPPMRFTKNVMDTITKAHPETAPKQYFNMIVIRGIAAFFIITIGFGLAYTLFTTNWSAPTNSTTTSWYSVPKVNVPTLFDSSFSNVAIAIIVIMGLALIDTALRTKKTHHHS